MKYELYAAIYPSLDPINKSWQITDYKWIKKQSTTDQ